MKATYGIEEMVGFTTLCPLTPEDDAIYRRRTSIRMYHQYQSADRQAFHAMRALSQQPINTRSEHMNKFRVHEIAAGEIVDEWIEWARDEQEIRTHYARRCVEAGIDELFLRITFQRQEGKIAPRLDFVNNRGE